MLHDLFVKQAKRISVIVPTRNRKDDLRKAVDSIATQLRRPDQLIVVDQSIDRISDDDLSKIRKILQKGCELEYIHNTSISGLVEAKHVGVLIAFGDIVCFLEDDIVLEPQYFSEIESYFRITPNMIGCSGVVTNASCNSRAYLFFHELFHQGIFFDPRPRVYANLATLGDRPIQSPAISGGLSAWRREVFENVPFDLASGFHMLEDIDFSFRIQQQYGPCLYINPRARLAHNFAPGGRDSAGRKENRKVREFLTFYRKHRRDSRDTFWLAWLLLGIALATCASSIRYSTFKPLLGFFEGLVVVMHKK